MGMIPRCEAGHNSINFYHIIQHKSYHKYILWGRQNLYIVILFNSCKTNCRRRVAQFGRALRSGRRGRRFKSCHTDRPAADIWFAAFLLQKPLIPKIGQGFFFCRLFLSGTYTKGDTDSPAHPNQFFCKRKIPYAHKNQWPVDFAH